MNAQGQQLGIECLHLSSHRLFAIIIRATILFSYLVSFHPLFCATLDKCRCIQGC